MPLRSNIRRFHQTRDFPNSLNEMWSGKYFRHLKREFHACVRQELYFTMAGQRGKCLFALRDLASAKV